MYVCMYINRCAHPLCTYVRRYTHTYEFEQMEDIGLYHLVFELRTMGAFDKTLISALKLIKVQKSSFECSCM